MVQCVFLATKYRPLKFQVPNLKEEICNVPEDEIVLPQPTLEHQVIDLVMFKHTFMLLLIMAA